MSVASISQLITVLIIFILVLGATYYVTMWIAKYQKNNVAGGNIEILETQRLSNTKYIQIIRVASKYLVISVSKDSVTLLTELTQDEYKPPEFAKAEIPDFSKELSKMMDRFKKK
ncbi:FliO/MopB family protein [Butyrivibrio sp. AE3006]|jgi:flagellar protein FliO/FliZ|uniref:FliO/MopB family protein n=1 Tax=Butyrivibrio sp. AE3006 TaxID=1280673 RepID=UPI0004181556|nr:flagellar biosynthetic protein FliO [Butyrivibrio sp. AE3006]